MIKKRHVCYVHTRHCRTTTAYQEGRKAPSMLNAVDDLHPPRRRHMILHVCRRIAQRVLQPVVPRLPMNSHGSGTNAFRDHDPVEHVLNSCEKQGPVRGCRCGRLARCWDRGNDQGRTGEGRFGREIQDGSDGSHGERMNCKGQRPKLASVAWFSDMVWGCGAN